VLPPPTGSSRVYPTVARKKAPMVQLDMQLLFDARRLFNGANVHRLKEMIFAYEQAVDLHNHQQPKHEIYQMQSELRLRKYVLDCRSEDLQRRSEFGLITAVEKLLFADVCFAVLEHSSVDKLTTLQEEAAQELNALMLSILSKAFSGEL
jgi:hypothetical protein